MKNIFLLLLFLSLSSYSQDLAEFDSKYQGEDVVIISLKNEIKITNKNQKLSIVENVSKSKYFITGKNLFLAKEGISYNTFNTISQINAQTFNLESSRKKPFIVKEFKDKDVLIGGIFFNDQKEKEFIYPNIKKGATTHLNYSRQIKDPHFMPSFIISDNIPIDKATYSVTFPNNVDVTFKTLNLEDSGVIFEEIKKNDNTTYLWKFNSVPKTSRHYDFSPLYYVPQIFVYIKSYTINDKKTEVLSNVGDLYSWYSKLISKINFTNQTELERITLDLIKDAESDEEKIKRIYYFIQDKINYIAFEDGLNGFIPRDAAKIFHNKYGDCKDMANILNEMLHYANIPSYLTWIGTRSKPYSYHELPTPVTDNHMITAVKVGENYKFLDATAKYLPYGYPSPFIQGKEALIGLSEEDFKIVKVPEIDASKNSIEITSDLMIKEDSLVGLHKATITGFEKLRFLHKLERKSIEDLDFLYWNLRFGTKKTSFNHEEYKNIDLNKDSLQIDFKTKTPFYVRNVGDEMYLKMGLDFVLKSGYVKNEKKNFDKEIDHKYIKKFITKLKLPKGYKIKNLPKNVNYDNNDFNFNVQYEYLEEENNILMTKTIKLNTLKIEKQDIDTWNDFIKKLNRSVKSTLILNKINHE